MKKTEIDEGFISRVYKTSGFVWIFGAIFCLGPLGWLAAAGWTLGCGLSVGVLLSLEWIIRRDFVPGAINAKRAFIKFTLVKVPVLLAVLALVVWVGMSSLIFLAAFSVGVLLTQLVMFLKVMGMLAHQRLNG